MTSKRALSMFAGAVVSITGAFLLVSFSDDQHVMGNPTGSTDDTKKSGPVQPGEDEILEVEGDDSDDVELWSAKVGESEFTGLDTSNVGDILFKGDLVSKTIVDDEGNETTIQVCAGIPPIETSMESGFETPGADSIELFLDLSKCEVSLTSVVYGVVDENISGSEPLLPLGYNWSSLESEDRNFPPVYTRILTENRFLPGTYMKYRDWHLGSDVLPQTILDRVFDIVVQAKLEAVDGVGFKLTQSEIEIRYNTRTFNVYEYQSDCSAHSPALLAGISWHRDSCSTPPYTRNASSVKGFVQGQYHGTIPRDRNINNTDTRHSSSVSFTGYSSRYRAVCRLESVDDITDELRITLPLLSLIKDRITGDDTFGVSFVCEDSPSVTYINL